MRRVPVLAMAMSAAILLWITAEPLHALRALPRGVGAWWVSYADNRTFGLGPGGNETGFNVVLLTRGGADRVATGGVGWLKAQGGGRTPGNWQQTPVPRDETWMGREGSAAGTWPDPTVRAILDRYGFGLDLPEGHRTALDTALNAPGSFYDGGQGVIVVIVPAAQRAFVFYAG